jgi:hypothetical protein
MRIVDCRLWIEIADCGLRIGTPDPQSVNPESVNPQSVNPLSTIRNPQS